LAIPCSTNIFIRKSSATKKAKMTHILECKKCCHGESLTKNSTINKMILKAYFLKIIEVHFKIYKMKNNQILY
jgi:hypothetical protein